MWCRRLPNRFSRRKFLLELGGILHFEFDAAKNPLHDRAIARANPAHHLLYSAVRLQSASNSRVPKARRAYPADLKSTRQIFVVLALDRQARKVELTPGVRLLYALTPSSIVRPLNPVGPPPSCPPRVATRREGLAAERRVTRSVTFGSQSRSGGRHQI